MKCRVPNYSYQSGDDVVREAKGLMNMYKQGFLDGWLVASPHSDPVKAWDSIKGMCEKSFISKFNVKKVKGGKKKRKNA